MGGLLQGLWGLLDPGAGDMTWSACGTFAVLPFLSARSWTVRAPLALGRLCPEQTSLTIPGPQQHRIPIQPNVELAIASNSSFTSSFSKEPFASPFLLLPVSQYMRNSRHTTK